MSRLWRSYLPYHVARDLIDNPDGSLVGREQRFPAAALFADISGFTAMSEVLGAAGGSGTEELTRLLNQYFEPMITLIDSFGGIIGKFGGDSLTAIFPLSEGSEQAAARRALQCALRMQERMQTFTTVPTSAGIFNLTMKIGLASGPVFSCVVGDISTRLEYIIAGSLLDRCAEANHRGRPGDVIVHADLLKAAGQGVMVVDRGEDFASLVQLDPEGERQPLPRLGVFNPHQEQVSMAFVHPSIAQRLHTGQLSFVNEHRRVTVVFMKFRGLDYDEDAQAAAKLQDYLQQVIQIVRRYDGWLNKVDMGDKGSKVLAMFGAPIAHEDDPERALRCALELRGLANTEEAISVTTGLVYCGQIGSELRREYTVIGRAVNLAARLMQNAQPGEILAGESTHAQTAKVFAWESTRKVEVKGRRDPVPVYPLSGVRQDGWLGLQEPKFSTPMVGRKNELELINKSVQRANAGQGQIIGITAEAGMGKSRLAAAAIKMALQSGLQAFGGECLSHGTTTSYLVWRDILMGMLGVNPAEPVNWQVHYLEQRLRKIEAGLLPRLPLLGTALNLPIPDNHLTRPLDARLRKASLEDLVVSLVRWRAKSGTLLLVLEDCHWIDSLSADLLEVVGRSIASLPVLIILVYRPFEPEQELAVSRLGHFKEITLSTFTGQEARELIEQRLSSYDLLPQAGQSAEMQKAHDEAVEKLLTVIFQRTQGNPFYIDEMINLIRDRRLGLEDIQSLETLDLPESLQSLILSRIDQLDEATKITLKVASVLGRSFRASWLWSVYPALGSPEKIREQLAQLSRLDITPLDKPEPELEYLFKHIVTREAAYESLAVTTRSMIHGQVAAFIERNYPGEQDRYLDLLAHHYGLSTDTSKQREYFRKAGDAARQAYANEAAQRYYRQLLPLLGAQERPKVMLAMSSILELTGIWGEARQLCQEALDLSDRLEDQADAANCQLVMGRLDRLEGRYAEALERLEKARQDFEACRDQQGLNEALREVGIIHWSQGEYEPALAAFEQCQKLSTDLGDQRGAYRALSNSGLVYLYQGEYKQASERLQRAREIADKIGDRLGSSVILGNLGNVYLELNDYHQALTYYSQSLSLSLELGDRLGVSMAVGNLGNIYWLQGELEKALQCYAYNLNIMLELGDRLGVCSALWTMAETNLVQGDADKALRLLEPAVSLARQLDTPYELSEYLYSTAEALSLRGDYAAALPVNDEAARLASEAEHHTVSFKALVMGVRLKALLGHMKRAKAVAQLESSLNDEREESDIAALHYEIWRLDNTQEAHRQEAANKYRELYRVVHNIEYNTRYQVLTGESLPFVAPPLPPLPEIVTRQPVDVEGLLAQASLL